MRVIEGGFCAACFNHVTEARLVEFDASFDGPVVDGVSFDELMVCEGCVKGAVEALNVKPEMLDQAVSRAEFAEGVAEKWRVYAETLEKNYASRPEVIVEPVAKTGRKR